jgi:hypothetical protein
MIGGLCSGYPWCAAHAGVGKGKGVGVGKGEGAGKQQVVFRILCVAMLKNLIHILFA